MYHCSEEARILHNKAIVFDATTLNYVLDEPYASGVRAGGIDVCNLTIVSDAEGWDETLRLIESAHERVARLSEFEMAASHDEVMAITGRGHTAIILGTQGASMLGERIERLRTLRRLGVRYFGLAYTGANLFADGCGETRDAGITFMGKDLIALADELGVILDLSHCGHRTRLEAAQLARFPVCTHSNAYEVVANDRNTRDEAIVEIARKGGVIGMCALVRAVSAGDATLDALLDHLDHVVRLVGHRHVGLGMDFIEAVQDAARTARRDEIKPPKWRVLRPDIFGTLEDFFTLSYPRGVERANELPNLTQGLVYRGYDEEQILDILGRNWLNHLARVDAAT